MSLEEVAPELLSTLEFFALLEVATVASVDLGSSEEDTGEGFEDGFGVGDGDGGGGGGGGGDGAGAGEELGGGFVEENVGSAEGEDLMNA